MKPAIGLLGYLAIGAAFVRSIGGPRSCLQWDEPPTPCRRVIVALSWPAILALVLVGVWDCPREERQQADELSERS